MPRAETETLTRIVWGAALSRGVGIIAELGIADQIDAGSIRGLMLTNGASWRASLEETGLPFLIVGNQLWRTAIIACEITDVPCIGFLSVF
jgi:hypothetical protein